MFIYNYDNNNCHLYKLGCTYTADSNWSVYTKGECSERNYGLFLRTVDKFFVVEASWSILLGAIDVLLGLALAWDPSFYL